MLIHDDSPISFQLQSQSDIFGCKGGSLSAAGCTAILRDAGAVLAPANSPIDYNDEGDW